MKLFRILLLILFLASIVGIVGGTQSEIQKITDSLGYHTYPDISSDYITWWDGYNIYFYDISKSIETQITNESYGQRDPAIYDNKIVWLSTTPDPGIFIYDISNGKKAKISIGNSEMDIFGDKVVYMSYRDRDFGVYMYDISSEIETKITPDNPLNDIGAPAINGKYIVWSQKSKIHMYDISTATETIITPNTNENDNPDIFGNYIVWEREYRDEGIYMYDISTGIETQIKTGLSSNPKIYGNYVVWEDWRNRNNDIYMYDISSGEETQITTDTSRQENPAIFENHIIWENWIDDHNNEIEMYTINSEITFDVSSYKEISSDKKSNEPSSQDIEKSIPGFEIIIMGMVLIILLILKRKT